MVPVGEKQAIVSSDVKSLVQSFSLSLFPGGSPNFFLEHFLSSIGDLHASNFLLKFEGPKACLLKVE